MTGASPVKPNYLHLVGSSQRTIGTYSATLERTAKLLSACPEGAPPPVARSAPPFQFEWPARTRNRRVEHLSALKRFSFAHYATEWASGQEESDSLCTRPVLIAQHWGAQNCDIGVVPHLCKSSNHLHFCHLPEVCLVFALVRFGPRIRFGCTHRVRGARAQKGGAA